MEHFGDDLTGAGRRLAQYLAPLRSKDVVVLGVARDGIPIAFEVAEGLGAPLDVVVVRSLTLPFDPEVTFGAVTEEGIRVVNDTVAQQTALGADQIAEVEDAQRVDLERQVQLYRRVHEPVPLFDRVVVIVDDELVSTAPAVAACRLARGRGATRVVVASPAGSAQVIDALQAYADDVVCPDASPFYFYATAESARHRRPHTSDDEVIALLDRSRRTCLDAAVQITSGLVELEGYLTIPSHARGAVIFAHGSGSSRHSLRNRYVAKVLNEAGFATLLFDLLTPAEEANRANVFDIEMLARRLIDATSWLAGRSDIAGLPLGYFGASTGAGAALRAAAASRVDVKAVVSRGGRPDLAGAKLADVTAATLLIVGDRDEIVLELNSRARDAMSAECAIAVVPGATHLFEEPGALEQVARLARDWFLGKLALHTAPR
ncbi:phosphoribosyltransferase family protein [Mycolicibacterium iranicum]|uniref:Phosphoribosyl transferase n=1 Tax=Mycolicibacterium iranicum TaxID=912594 RepID=A0A178LZA7_MYCIR|nr:phosphoribosyltransferase family protein [Mycolicibacterium iranicum]OAN39954.1 phosphoribosyl transferase [Mycolicibacterium iranicum]